LPFGFPFSTKMDAPGLDFHRDPQRQVFVAGVV